MVYDVSTDPGLSYILVFNYRLCVIAHINAVEPQMLAVCRFAFFFSHL